jgi:GNAT superfamily N-acetyltransferase
MPIEISSVGNKILFDYIYRNTIASRLEVKPIKRKDISDIKGIDLISIYTEEKHRGKGYAIKLILELIKYCKRNGYTYIITDDATDTFPPKNIYYKMGFLVRDDDGNWTKWTSNIEPDEERLYIVV